MTFLKPTKKTKKTRLFSLFTARCKIKKTKPEKKKPFLQPLQTITTAALVTLFYIYNVHFYENQPRVVFTTVKIIIQFSEELMIGVITQKEIINS